MKRWIVLFFTFCMVISLCFAGTFSVSADMEHLSMSAELSDYENGEVLVFYSDGTMEVLNYEDQHSLSDGLKELAEDKNVTWFQPNYSYEYTALSTSDSFSAQQWALCNDGSFEMKEKSNPFPVYDSPFSHPVDPWTWIMPDFFGFPGGWNPISWDPISWDPISWDPISWEPISWMFPFQTSSDNNTRITKAVLGIDINVENAWKIYNGGKREVIVALIDTGVDYTHEDFGDIFWTNDGEIAGNGIDDDGNGYVDDVRGWNFYNNNNRIYTSANDDSHGTHGAGTIMAASDNNIGIAGIVNSESVKLMVIKALGGSSGSGTTESIIKGIKYAEENGASICNLSLGSSWNDRALYNAIANSNMLFVVAAGNDGKNTDTTPSYPASYELDNIISVANLNYDGTLHSSSDYGVISVDLAAPGSYILSTTPKNGYSYMTGTSMAAPMVTGAAAMIYSHYDTISLADVKEIILNTVKKSDTLKGNVLTGGMLDLGADMNYDLDLLSGEKWGKPDIEEEVGQHVMMLQIGNPFLYVDGYGKNIDNSGTVPIILNNCTMLPIRAVIETMGGKVGWDNSNQTVTLELGSKTLYLKIGTQYAWNNEKTISLNCAPILRNNRTLLPVRAVVEYFGGVVEWINESRIIVIKY